MTRYTTDPVCMQSMASAHKPFLKKDYCAHQNRGIAGHSIVPKRFAPDQVQERSHDIFAKSILTSQFSHIISTSLA